MSKPPFNRLNFAAAAVEVEPHADGGMVLRSPQALGAIGRCTGEWLEHWGTTAPERPFLAERRTGDWHKVSYGAALKAVRSLGQALVDRGLSPQRPVVILSDNGVDHALLMLAAMHVGVPAAPISAAYSLMSKDHGKLKHILELLEPGLVFAADGARFRAALKAVDLKGAEVVVSANPPEGLKTTAFTDLLATPAGAGVAAAFAAVGPDTIAKFLFTSGSTDLPKGVINTQRMLLANQQAIVQLWPFLEEKTPRIVDWLPWSHTFGGNHNFNMMLRHGGSIWIDDGKPMPGLIEKTVANLREVSPTLYFNVPRGFDVLLPYLEKDEGLRSNFFKDLDLIFYAGAALPQNLWERIEEVSVAARGERVRLVSAWGSTETAPMVTSVHFGIDRAGVIGLPGPGSEIKMLPNAGKLELRVRGPNVTPGYWKRDDLTKAAFDAEGYYCIGDAGRFANPDEPAHGIEFDGRIAEDFKLMSGTWVHVGALRLKVIAAGAPVVQDAVITGHNREEIGLLIFASDPGCRSLCPDLPADTPLARVITDPRVRAKMAAALARVAFEATGGSNRPTRALLMSEPPSIDANEITDKGYINQRAALLRRAELVERLYAEAPDADVITLARASA
jgi:feruloyl-CoA synthase